MDVRKESHVAAALKYIEENLPVGEEGLYGLVNNAGVSCCHDSEHDCCHGCCHQNCHDCCHDCCTQNCPPLDCPSVGISEVGNASLLDDDGNEEGDDPFLEGCHQFHFVRCVCAVSLTGKLGVK